MLKDLTKTSKRLNYTRNNDDKSSQPFPIYKVEQLTNGK
jgi:hypothetical protein